LLGNDLPTGGPRPTVDLTAGPTTRPWAVSEGPDGYEGAGAAPETPISRPPKNRMEAHFQMTLLVEEVARPASSDATGRDEAIRLREAAQGAYAATDYTEALRLALKGRRALGARLETLPPGRSPPPTPPAAAAPMASSVAGRTCPQCGRPVRPDDRFCRGCGASNVPSKCPRCQAEVAGADTFCGRCGAPIS
jgi:hypothetical protein